MDLRAEIQNDEKVEHICDDYRKADLTPRERAILDFSVKLTKTPGDMSRADVEKLRADGLDDVAIHDVAQVTAYFNYINRIADALGVDLEDFMKEDGQSSDQRNP